MDALAGADEDDHVVERLLDADASGQHGAVGEPDSNSIVQQVGVQGRLQQLHGVSTRGPANHHADSRTHQHKLHASVGSLVRVLLLPVDEPVAGDRQQLPAVFIMKGSGAVGKLHTCGRGAHTCTGHAHMGVKAAIKAAGRYNIKHTCSLQLLCVTAEVSGS